MRQITILFLFSLGSLFAQLPDYFPLVPGSRWVYRGGRLGDTLSLTLGDPTVIGSNTYHRLSGYAPNDVLIRRTADGAFVYWDETAKAEAPFLLLDGQAFPSIATTCKQTGQLNDRQAEYKGPIGYFDNARTIQYTPGICADAGLTSETYVANLGLVRRAQTSFIGERVVELIYAQIGGVTYLNEAGVSFSIALTKLTAGQIAVRLNLNNRTDTELTLRFPSSQTFNFVVRNERGETVYFWAADKLFAQVVRTVRIKGEEVWTDSFTLPELRPGNYSVEGVLVNDDGKAFSATANLTLP